MFLWLSALIFSSKAFGGRERDSPRPARNRRRWPSSSIAKVSNRRQLLS